MKKVFCVFIIHFLVSCVYAPSQAWKPHVAVESTKKYKSPKPQTTSTKLDKKEKEKK